MNVSNIQLRRLIGINDLSRNEIDALLSNSLDIMRLPSFPHCASDILRGKTVVLAFFETSTRTRCSFELAAKRLGAHTIFFQQSGSSLEKGESLFDTLETIDAMGADIWVVRHPENGIPELMSNHSSACIVNAGDGSNEHPTQALLDAATLIEQTGSIEGMRLCFVGNVSHSRVALSGARLFSALGAEIGVCAPESWHPTAQDFPKAAVLEDIQSAVQWADAVVMLRIQRERMSAADIPNLEQYIEMYGLRKRALMSNNPSCLLLHPGPVNYGIELDVETAHLPQSLIQRQVRNGIAVRMATLSAMAGQQ